MKLISHRGNIDGKQVNYENNPFYVREALNQGYDVEVDVWFVNGKWYLGHDTPQYLINFNFILNEKKSLWVHCKDVESIVELSKIKSEINYFWHQEDLMTITSLGYLWVYPGKQPVENSIAVLPEIHNDNLSKCIGLCSDFIKKYRHE